MAFRLALAAVVAAVVGCLALLVAGYLGALAALSATGVVLGLGAHVPGLTAFGVVGVLGFAVLGTGVVLGARRLDRVVRAADEEPDPLDELRERYVGTSMDLDEFERRAGRLLRRRGPQE